MHLYLLRHGDALERGYADADRPLSRLGVEQALRVATFLESLNAFPAVVFASPLVRTQQMATIVCKHLRLPPPETSEYLLPESNEQQIIRHLNSLAPTSALLVGHEPHLRSFISIMIHGNRSGVFVLPKAALAYVETGHPIEKGKGVLNWVRVPERMGLGEQ